MESMPQPLKAEQTDPAINVLKPTPRKTFVLLLVIACMATTMATAPTGGVSAGGGLMIMQYEFSLSKKPVFHQLNLAFQDDVGENPSHYLTET